MEGTSPMDHIEVEPVPKERHQAAGTHPKHRRHPKLVELTLRFLVQAWRLQTASGFWCLRAWSTATGRPSSGLLSGCESSCKKESWAAQERWAAPAKGRPVGGAAPPKSPARPQGQSSLWGQKPPWGSCGLMDSTTSRVALGGNCVISCIVLVVWRIK